MRKTIHVRYYADIGELWLGLMLSSQIEGSLYSSFSLKETQGKGESIRAQSLKSRFSDLIFPELYQHKKGIRFNQIQPN